MPENKPVVKTIEILCYSAEDADMLLEEINDLLPIMGIQADVACLPVPETEVSNVTPA